MTKPQADTRYDRLEARFDALLTEYMELVKLIATMRQTGFATTTTVKTPRPSEDVERTAVDRAERRIISANKKEFIANAKQALIEQGVPAAVAEQEAKRLFAQATDLDPAPT